MNKADIDYKNAVVLTKKFISKRRKYIKRGASDLIADVVAASELAFPFSGKKSMNAIEWDLNARIVLSVVAAMTSFKDN